MFNQEAIEQRLYQLQQNLSFKLIRYPREESIGRAAEIAKSYDQNDNLLIDLRKDELVFIANEKVHSTWDFRYFFERYSHVSTPGGQLVIPEVWESQDLALRWFSIWEKEAWEQERPLGVIWDKARQQGATQVSQVICCHRIVFHENQRVIIASDAPTPTIRLFRRFEAVLDRLPPWMKPQIENRLKTDEGEALFLKQRNNSLIIGHGRKKGGGIGQGDSTNVFHLTEIPDWENIEQLDSDFLPTFHSIPTNIGIVESTAKRRGDWFHVTFMEAWEGKHQKLRALFIPYYAHRGLYRMRYPTDWIPSRIALEHAESVKKFSPLYCHGVSVTLSKEQLYWWEMNYMSALRKNNVSVFLQEYASNHWESFQNHSIGMFPADLVNEIRQRQSPFQIYSIVGT